MMKLPLVLCALVLGMGGCLSIEGKRVYTDKNGEIKTADVGGIPIVIQRPTKAMFVVTTKTYAVSIENYDDQGQLIDTVEFEVEESELNLEPTMLGPSEVYAIDMKRPASGTIDYSMELANYYPTKLGAKLDDKTLDAVTNLVTELATKVIPGLGILPEGTPPDGADGDGVDKESGSVENKSLIDTKITLLIIDLETGGIMMQDL